MVSWAGLSEAHAHQVPFPLFPGTAMNDTIRLPVQAQDLPAGGAVVSCIQNTLGRLPVSPQDLSQSERAKIFQACPESVGRLGVLLFGTSPGSEEEILQQLRGINQALRKLESDTQSEIQQELDRIDSEREDPAPKRMKDLQQDLERIDELHAGLKSEFEVKARKWDGRKKAQKAQELNGHLAGLERERGKLQRETQDLIQSDIALMDQASADRERQLQEEMNRTKNTLENRRSELEDQLQRLRSQQGQSQRQLLDRQRLDQERKAEQARLQQQQQLDQQRIDQERQLGQQRLDQERENMERERQLAEDRLKQQRDLDQQRIDQERQRLEQERLLELERQRLETQRPGQDVVVQNTPLGPTGAANLPGPSDRLPTRGFFNNSSSGEINDIDKLLDPSALAVLGILITLVATSLSLVNGN